MKIRKQDILNGNITQQLILILIPVFLGYLFQQLYSAVGAAIVGKYVGKEALAAVGGTTGTLTSLLVNFVIGVAAGITVVIAQYYGRGEFEEVYDCVKTGFFLAVVLGGTLTVVGFASSGLLLKITNVPDEVYGYSLAYMQIFYVGMIPNMIYNVGASILRAVGDSKRPLYFLIVSCVANIILDIVFVKYLNMSVMGIAISTVIAQVISCLLIIITFARANGEYKYTLKDFGFDKHLLKKILAIGLPCGIQSVLYSVSNIYVQAKVNSYGTDYIAAHTAYGKIDAFFWNFDSSIGVAVMTVVGQNFGAHNIDRVKKTTIKAIVLEFICATIMISSFLIFRYPLFKIFTNDLKVIEIGVNYLKLLSPFWPIYIIVEVISSVIKAAGKSFESMLISALGMCAVRFIWLTFFAGNTIYRAMLCYPISYVITATTFVIYYLSNRWNK